MMLLADAVGCCCWLLLLADAVGCCCWLLLLAVDGMGISALPH
ncbi:MAG TPA: phosphatidylglycerophosphatase [Thioploca sp.]|nr:MAG: phosphatidylglycerophosphatase [Gammaproteobacteria bacterium]HDN25646.1 phosphatidylglycerophosphatase [Thioploca sp.]